MSDIFITLLINGVLLASIYLLISLGLTLVFGVMNVINFAHGGFIMAGGYVTYWLAGSFGVDPILSLVVVIPVVFAGCYAIQLSLLEKVIGQDDLYTLLLTFGILLVLESVFRLQFGTQSQTMEYLSAPVTFGEVSISMTRIATGAIGLIAAGALFAFLNWSRQGQAIRATSQAPNLAEASGIDSRRIRALTFGLGGVLAGIGGTAYFLTYSISPVGGRHLLLIAFVVVVLGGMNSLRGTVAAAFIVGIYQTFVQFQFGSTEALFTMFIGIAVLLLIRPHGLFGEPEGRLHG
ncbi:branched-chain amino acid ABC transporter permease [Natrarchaeobius oligotrophus]|uniref:Branched-chain amino acid ABC transporter permease n=1 Tax=Natrarchaeobius chitinivorans TaxID=1679083 RepID=A0A3N6N418_NATCH|nr:branched-chain amino acid ABC transporter permease [Natrarchaeobius chitinivorans]RQH02457.1 branched-chain amino acid ABC transporter permease [Natrarchaeobius chitinivorans]